MVTMSNLKELSFFSDFKPTELEILAHCAKGMKFQEGSVVLREGKSANGFHVITSGKAVIEIGLEGNHREIQILAPGDLIGWSWQTPFKNWHFDVLAAEPLETFWFDADDIEGTFVSHPHLHLQIMKRIIGAMADRIHFLENELRCVPKHA